MRKPLKFTRPSATVLVTAAIAAVIAASGTAFAATKLITGAQIANNSITGADIKQNSLTGADIKPNSVTGADIKPGSVNVNDLAKGAITALDGKDGKDGAQGPKGDTGAAGAKGAQGPKGDTGAPGAKGDQGDAGVDAPAPEYGVGAIWAETNPAWGVDGEVPWGRYVTSPLPSSSWLEGMASGEVRLTCKTAHAPCRVWLTGAVASDSSVTDAKMQAHIRIERGGEEGALDFARFCEAGEVGNQAPASRFSVPRVTLADDQFDAASPAQLPIAIGSSDCGGGSASGTVNEILLPAGYYDIKASFRFWKG